MKTSRMYYIEENTCFISAHASSEFISWAQAMCKLKGYVVVFMLPEVEMNAF